MGVLLSQERRERKSRREKKKEKERGKMKKVPFGGGDGSITLGSRNLAAGEKGEKKGSLKLSIKPFLSSSLPRDFEEKCWGKLNNAVEAVHTKRKVGTSLQELYNLVQDLVVNKLGNNLYDKLEKVQGDRTAAVFKTLDGSNLKGREFLSQFNSAWDTLCCEAATIKNIFTSLDRSIKLTTTKRDVTDMSLFQFRVNLMSFTGLQHKLIDTVLQEIKAERDGVAVNRLLLKQLTSMLQAVSFYTAFEAPFLTGSKQYYVAESAKLLVLHDGPCIARYLHLISKRLEEEENRVLTYLSQVTRKPLITEVERNLIAVHSVTILTAGFSHLMSNMMLAELTLLHQHFSLPSVQKLDLLRDSLGAYIKKTGIEIMNGADTTIVQELLKFKANLDLVCSSCFSSQKEFTYTIRDSCEAFVNLNPSKPAQLLAKYIDTKMKPGGKETEDELEPHLDSCLDIFRMIQAKDVFEAFYNKDFAKRLLLARSASLDLEKSFISKLKAACGPSFTTKLEGMLKDMEVSKEVFSGYKPPTKSDISLVVQILTESHWPTYQSTQISLPPKMSEALEGFKSYYLGKYSGRKLTWQPCLCTCTVKATFGSTKKELIVSLLQALVLLLFNTEREASFSRIKEAVGTGDADLTRSVQALVFSQARVLKRRNKGGKDILDTDVFTVNEDFQHKHFRVKINGMQMKETAEEAKGTNDKVLTDRVHAVDACLVRTMKSRKSLVHSELISSVFTQLKFPVETADIKKRIEILIEREYFRRDDEQQNLYHYVA
eukprot:TRINITY_DN12139_c0_g2_i1.p1 TRINITY_DN12139_c0_g2~~TRINITY_DN12139_c0_g2_i1.p1  ORF type:complete len:771 (+),score=170.73 TRINITY_DN12139_c0_g2_i1:320-2632(+)